MLLKYLNELDSAVAIARAHPDSNHLDRCMECAAVLDDYLAGQMEPVRVRGEELMRQLWPDDSNWPSIKTARQYAFPLRH